MKTHKFSTRPRTADTSILSRENLLALTRLIEDARIDHHCPPSLGLFTSVTVTMLYLEENIRQQVLATLFEVSQPTISRAITCILNVLDTILPFPPTPKDLDVHRFYVLDGTLVECWGWKTTKNSTAVNIRKLVSTCKYLPTKQEKSTTYPTHYQDQHMISTPCVRLTYLITFHPITSPLIKDISVLDATFPSAGNPTQNYTIGNNGLTKASNASAT